MRVKRAAKRESHPPKQRVVVRKAQGVTLAVNEKSVGTLPRFWYILVNDKPVNKE